MSLKKDFYFLGKAPLSKSLLNRALIIKSWFPKFKILGTSACDDIQIMEQACQNLQKEIFCGLSGTAFRFLSLRVSREKGEFFLKGEPGLLRRPLEEGKQLFSQLGVDFIKEKQGYRVISQGWKCAGDYLNIPYKITSQHASGLLLNAWDLENDLYFSINRNQVSRSYFQMTLDFVRSLGMDVRGSDAEGEYCILKRQTLQVFTYKPEQDYNCLFVLACLAALKGQACFLDWQDDALQPEACFTKILQDMQVKMERNKDRLSIFKTKNLQACSVNLNSAPDLFPVLAALASQAQGQSCLSGLGHVNAKESPRLDKMQALLEKIGVSVVCDKESCTIQGQTGKQASQDTRAFSCSQDHRIAMAACLLREIGISIQIEGEDAVSKSFPEFFNLI